MKKFTLLTILPLFALACQFSALQLESSNMAMVATTASRTPLPFPSSTPGAARCTVKAYESLNVRAAPGISNPVIAWLAHGDVVTILSDPPVENWIHIKTQSGFEGWINSKYCEVTND